LSKLGVFQFSNKINGARRRTIAVRFRYLSARPRAPKFSWIIYSPRAPGHEQIDSQLADYFGASNMNDLEFGGDDAIAVHVERTADEADERTAALTRPDSVPTPEEGAEFIAEALKFLEAIDGHPAVPPPAWWTAPLPANELPSIVPEDAVVPPGRRFRVTYQSPTGLILSWFFPDADDGIFTDSRFRPIDPPASVRKYAERHASAA
jgi:hypothetical protein